MAPPLKNTPESDQGNEAWGGFIFGSTHDALSKGNKKQIHEADLVREKRNDIRNTLIEIENIIYGGLNTPKW